ncbi:MAG: hypothetical protein AB2693_12710, partial [Candidatus Thiodiazotropha sp.]
MKKVKEKQSLSISSHSLKNFLVLLEFTQVIIPNPHNCSYLHIFSFSFLDAVQRDYLTDDSSGMEQDHHRQRETESRNGSLQ